MRRAVIYLLAMAAIATATAAERRSWNKIRYAGGTVTLKTSRYDWNTTLVVSLQPDRIAITIAPARLFDGQQTIDLKPTEIVSLSAGAAAWRRVGEVAGSKLPAKPPSLFGILQDGSLLGIVYETEGGKRGAVLLESPMAWQILTILSHLTGRTVERSP